ncbi:MAG: DoxX family protein [Mycobacterium leprae]
MSNFLKSKNASWIWLVLRLYVGYEFMTAGWEKITGPKAFDASGFLQGAVKGATGAHPTVQPWFAAIVKSAFLPSVGLFNFLVPWGELLTGIALIIGFASSFALVMALLMNYAYMFSGSTSTNVQLSLLEVILLAVGGAYVGFLGVDYWFRPVWRKLVKADGGSKAAA